MFKYQKQQIETDKCGTFEYFYKNFFGSKNQSAISNQKNLNKKNITDFIKKLFQFDKRNYEDVVQEYIVNKGIDLLNLIKTNKINLF